MPAKNSPNIVELHDVVKEYPLGNLTVRALDGISLTIRKGEFVTIAGPSGSGKTTALNLIGCMDVATSGQVHIDGQETSGLSERQLTSLRLFKIGFIFQSFNLVPVLNLFQNVELPLLLQGKHGKAERTRRVEEMIDQVGLTQQRTQRPNELSGGQRQRVAIARALITNPLLVLADEPTANLDTVNSQNIIDLMKELNHKNQTTFIFSTHDPMIMGMAERIIRLVDGRVVDDDATKEAAIYGH